MKQNLLNKLWLRVGMIVAVMTTALAGTAWAQGDYSTDYTGNVTLSTTGGTSASTCVVKIQDGTVVNSYDGIKAGTSKVAGAIKITVPSGTKYLHMHVAAWNNETVTLAVTPEGYSDNISLTADAGVSNNSPFTLASYNKAATDYYKVITFASALTADTDLTFKATGGKRFVVWGVTAEADGGSGGDTSVATTVTIDDSGINNTDVYAGTAAGTLKATVVAGEETITNAEVTWSGNNDAVATIDASTGAVTLVAAGTVTFKAEYAGVDGTYKPSSKTYEMTVTNSDPNVPGSENNPYTVAEARAAIDAGTGVTGVYATGIVSKIVTAFNPTFGNISYNISADGTETADQLQAYRGFSYNGDGFTSADDIQVGDVVVVYGNLKKYNSTYEFDSGNQLVSLDRPVITTPTITATPTSLTGFTYVVDNGPSAAQTFTINGVNLTGNLNAVLDAASNFEVSVNENSDYSDHVYSDASVLPRTIYVRLKEGLAVGDYSGTITLTSEGAETVTVALTGSVTVPEAANVTWDLSTNSYDEITDEAVVTWSSAYATMTNSSKSGGTKASNYLGGDANNRTSSRFYNGNNLTIAPALGYKITSIEFVATSENYASVLKNSKWTNAEVAVSSTTVTVTPTDGSVEVSAAIGGTCGFTSVKVYYEQLADFAPVWSALPTPTITAGDAYEFYPSDYVAGLPAPGITLETTAPADTYDYDNGYFLFASDTAGEYVFTFTATNTEGSASATLTITVEDAPLPVASIDLGETTISAPYEGLDGTIDVTYNNLTDVLAEVQFVEADGTTPATYSWVAANIDTNRNIEYIIEENTSTDARTAYMKVYAVGNEGDAYSELITITQAGYVVDYATLPFVWTGGTKEDLLAENGVTAHDLGKNYADSNAPYLVKLDTDGDYIEVKTDCQPVLVSLDVKMLGGSNTSTITVQESNDGVTFADVEELAIEGVQNDVLYLQTASAFDAATRYVRLYFTKGSNVGVGGITIEKEFEEIATVGAAGYATYVTKHNVAFPADVAYIGALNENSVSMTAVTAVPKGTPLILKGEGTYTLSLASANELADVSGNELKASETDVVADGTQYILAKPANEPVGFYQATGTIPAGKAYLVVPSSSVKAFYFSFDDDATGLSDMSDMSDQSDLIFNLAGQRIQKLQRGINIVGGKKVMVK